MTTHPKKRKRLDKGEARIVIVGCGLAGLSVALALERAGFTRITLYERDESFESQKEGYGLTLTYNPKGPLASLGILEEVAQQDCPSRSHYLFRPDGSILGYFGNAFAKSRGNGQRGNLRVPRKVLRKLLLNKLECTNVCWGHKLVDYSFDGSTCRYHLSFTKIMEKESSLSPSEIAVETDLLVAADGIRSMILTKVYENSYLGLTLSSRALELKRNKETSGNAESTLHIGRGLRSMGVRLILGIAEFSHPLLTERGFYTLDGKHRLFTMPYSSNRLQKEGNGCKVNRIMWQLSFVTSTCDKEDDISRVMKSLDASSLRDYVIKTCRSWHDPVLNMIQSTPLESIWGTDLMDRDPEQVLQMIKSNGIRRMVVVGDALHSMSPFKGQGANQALADGPLLANWLGKASVDSAVTSFWREIVQRTAPVVAASRGAAIDLHSPSILKEHGFAGVMAENIGSFLANLSQRGIGAGLGGKLDTAIASAIEEFGVGALERTPCVCPAEQTRALSFAAAGDTQSLRKQSLQKHFESIRTALEPLTQRSCLHLAVINGHFETAKWLLLELGCDAHAKDKMLKIPQDYATTKPIIDLFDAVLIKAKQ